MREEDIYGSKQKYEHFMEKLNSLTNIPKPNLRKKYYCKNPVNLQYFHKLNTHFDVKDISYSPPTRSSGVVLKFATYKSL